MALGCTMPGAAAALKNQKYGNTLTVVRQGSGGYFACGHTTDISIAEHNMDTFKLLKGNNTVIGLHYSTWSTSLSVVL